MIGADLAARGDLLRAPVREQRRDDRRPGRARRLRDRLLPAGGLRGHAEPRRGPGPPAANWLFQSVENLTWAIGPLIGGALVAAAGPDPAYWVNAATFLVSALLLVRIPGRRFQAGVAESHGHWRDLLEGFALVMRSRALLTVLLAWNVFMLASAGINVAEVFLAKDTFDAGDFGSGCSWAPPAWGSCWAASPPDRCWSGIRSRAIYRARSSWSRWRSRRGRSRPNVWVAAGCVLVVGAANGTAVGLQRAARAARLARRAPRSRLHA